VYTIKHASEVTGVSVATLRAWERRYGIVTPHRTEAGYRLYDADAVHALSVMTALVVEGWAPRQAAAETRRRIESGAAPVALDSAGDSAEPAGTAVFVDAAARLDAVTLAEVLDERFSRGSFESVVDGWLMPALRALGEGWAEGRVSVAGEHLAASAVQRRLAAAYDAAASRASGPRVIVGLPPGARHELGALAFATAARRAGLAATYLGADLPAADWSWAVAAHRAAAAVLSAARGTEPDGLRSVVTRLRADSPDLVVAVGGAERDEAPQGCLRLEHEIGVAAAHLASILAG
jgi:MerR family transcriptional regulator, light-induced transcriptional regulator